AASMRMILHHGQSIILLLDPIIGTGKLCAFSGIHEFNPSGRHPTRTALPLLSRKTLSNCQRSHRSDRIRLEQRDD
ncbi:MAG: hypothetical protein WAV05_13150, partial [Anaerolineales bacterium]